MKNMKFKPVIILLFLLLCVTTFSQNAMTQPINVIREIVVETNREDDPNVTDVKQLVLDQSGLKIGSPRSTENVANAIRVLWGINIFDDVQVHESLLENGLKITIYVSILPDRKSTRLNSSHIPLSRMPSSA